MTVVVNEAARIDDRTLHALIHSAESAGFRLRCIDDRLLSDSPGFDLLAERHGQPRIAATGATPPLHRHLLGRDWLSVFRSLSPESAQNANTAVARLIAGFVDDAAVRPEATRIALVQDDGEASAVNQMIQTARFRAGQLGERYSLSVRLPTSDRQRPTQARRLRFHVGDQLRFLADIRSPRFHTGDIARIRAVHDTTLILALDGRNRRIDVEKFSAFALGYALPIAASASRVWDSTHVLHAASWKPQTARIALSRHRERVQFHADPGATARHLADAITRQALPLSSAAYLTRRMVMAAEPATPALNNETAAACSALRRLPVSEQRWLASRDRVQAMAALGRRAARNTEYAALAALVPGADFRSAQDPNGPQAAVRNAVLTYEMTLDAFIANSAPTAPGADLLQQARTMLAEPARYGPALASATRFTLGDLALHVREIEAEIGLAAWFDAVSAEQPTVAAAHRLPLQAGEDKHIATLHPLDLSRGDRLVAQMTREIAMREHASARGWIEAVQMHDTRIGRIETATFAAGRSAALYDNPAYARFDRARQRQAAAQAEGQRRANRRGIAAGL